MTPRDAIIAKARKLRQLTTSNGATEAEAARAAEILARLIDEHNLTQTDLELRETAKGCGWGEYCVLSESAEDWTTCRVAISGLFHCHSAVQTRDEDLLGLGFKQQVTYFKIFGFPEDVEAALALSEICQQAIAHECDKWCKAQGRRPALNRVKSFRVGMAQRLAERIAELQAAPIRTGNSLIVLKNQLVREQLEASGFRGGRGMRQSVAGDPKAHAAGQAAANNVRLGRQGEISRAPLAIGRN